MKYTIKQGNISACIAVFDETGKTWNCIYMADGKPIQEGVSGSNADGIARFMQLPQQVREAVERQFVEVFALPIEDRAAWIFERDDTVIDTGPLEWAELWAAMRPEPHHWVLTTQNMFDEMLGAVPPRAMGNGCFLVGEADHHNNEGRAVYACFKHIHGGGIEARYMTSAEFTQLKMVRG
jgi:hypothetical protein